MTKEQKFALKLARVWAGVDEWKITCAGFSDLEDAVLRSLPDDASGMDLASAILSEAFA